PEIRGVEEGLVAKNRTRHFSLPLVLDRDRLLSLKKVSSIQSGIVMLPLHTAMKLIGSALGDHVEIRDPCTLGRSVYRSDLELRKIEHVVDEVDRAILCNTVHTFRDLAARLTVKTKRPASLLGIDSSHGGDHQGLWVVSARGWGSIELLLIE